MPSRRLFVLLCLAAVLLASALWWHVAGGEATLSGAAGPASNSESLAQRAQATDQTIATGAIRDLSLRKVDQDFALFDRLAREAPSPAARAAAAAALGLYPKQADVPQLINQTRTEADATVLAGRVKGLARLSNPKRRDALPLFVELLAHPDRNVRLNAITGLTNITITRFPGYRAERPPEELQDAIRVIRDFLIQHKLL